jgi:SulP family sulfate permease
MTSFTHKAAPPAPGFADLYTPKLVTVLREGYGLRQSPGRRHRRPDRRHRRPAIIHRHSRRIRGKPGAGPDHGDRWRLPRLGRSAAAGSRSAARPAPSSCWSTRPPRPTAWTGLILAVLLSGLLLALAGWLRLGTFVKFVPYPVTVGFTAGIAIIIGSSQLKDLFGLTLVRGRARAFPGESCPRSPPPRPPRTGTPSPLRPGRWP